MREMKGAIKQIKKVTHKVEAAALGLHQNVKHVAENFITPAPTKDFAEPPEIIGGVAYANPARNSRRTPGTNSPLRSDALRIPQGVDWSAQELVEARAASGLCSETHGGSAWWTAPGQDLYLCVAVREARNLPIADYDRRSTSPYVRITLGDSEGGRTPFFEAQTRTCHRNRNPMWEQCFFFPLSRLNSDTRFCLTVAGKSKLVEVFSGHINTTLGHLLEPAVDIMEPFSTRYRLTKRRQGDRVSGEVYLTITVLPKWIFDVVHFSEDSSTLLDPQMLQTLLSRYCLRIAINELRNLRTSKDDLLQRGDLLLNIMLGRKQLTIPFKPKAIQSYPEGSTKVHSFLIDEQISIPMCAVYDMDHKWNATRKSKDEIGDIKVKLLLGKHVLAKTQIPVWDVPLCADEDEEAAEDGGLQRKDTRCSAEDAKSEAEAPAVKETSSSYLSHFHQLIRGIYDSSPASATAAAATAVVAGTAAAAGAAAGATLAGAAGVAAAGAAAVAGATAAVSGATATAAEQPGLMRAYHSDAAAEKLAAAGAAAAAGPGSAGSPVIPDHPIRSATVDGGTTTGRSSTPDRPPRHPGTASPVAAVPEPHSAAPGPDSAASAPLVTGLAIMRNNLRKVKGPCRYTRCMEVYSDLINDYPEMDITMHFAFPSDDAMSVSGDEGSEDLHEGQEGEEQEAAAAQEEDGAAPTPIAMPPPLAVVVTETLLPLRPLKLFNFLFAPESPFQQTVIANEGLRDMNTSPWVPDPLGPKGAKTRTRNYIRPLSIPVPMAPKQCNVTEVQQLLVKEAGGFVLEKRITTNAPKGDAFFVLIQIAGTAEGSGTRTRVSFKVEFVKSVGLLKGAVEGGAVSSTKQLMKAWMDEAVKMAAAAASSPGGGGPSAPTGPSAGALAEPAAAPSPAAQGPRGQGGLGGGAGAVAQWVQVGALVVVALFLLYLGTGLRSIALSLDRLAAAVAAGRQAEVVMGAQGGAAGLPGEGAGSVAALAEAAKQLLLHLQRVAAAAGQEGGDAGEL